MITEVRLEALKEQVIDQRKLKSEAQLRELDWRTACDDYMAHQNRFNNEYSINETTRAHGYDMLKNTQIMAQFLVELTPEEVDAANHKIPHMEDAKQMERLENEATQAAAERIKRIKVWSEIADNFTNDEKAAAIREHKERMARYRKRKDWEAWVEEDDLDIEGDRIISEIKNYKSEHFWNTHFYP